MIRSFYSNASLFQVPAGQAVADTIDRLFNVVKSVVNSIPYESATHLKRGFETLSRILLQAQQWFTLFGRS